VKSRLAFLSIGFLAVSAAVGASCAKDNSVGGDTVTGQGGTSATGQGGQTASGTGGTTADTGTAGTTGSLTGTGGSGTGGSGTGGSGATTSGSGGSTGGSITGIAGSGGSGAAAGTNGAGGTTGGGGHGTGGVVGTTGAGGTGPVVIKAGGPSNCAAIMAPPISATLCDGFETATTTPDATTWKVSGTTTVDTTTSYGGTKSIKVSSTGAQTGITVSKIFTGSTKATNNEFWGRYFYLSNVPLASYPAGHSVFAALNGGPTDTAGDQFHFIGGSRTQLMAQISVGGGDKYTDPGGKNAGGTEPHFPVATDGWQCWEWHVTATDSYNFFINGTEVTEMAIVAGKATYSKSTLSPFPIFASMFLGWQFFGTGTAVSGWIDEVAVGPNRIGCGI